jgi:hypothetical protein
LVAPELELEAVAFADLERRASEPMDKVVGGEPNDSAGVMLSRRGFRRFDCRGARCAGGEEEASGKDDKTAHGNCMAAATPLRKLLAAPGAARRRR